MARDITLLMSSQLKWMSTPPADGLNDLEKETAPIGLLSSEKKAIFTSFPHSLLGSEMSKTLS